MAAMTSCQSMLFMLIDSVPSFVWNLRKKKITLEITQKTVAHTFYNTVIPKDRSLVMGRGGWRKIRGPRKKYTTRRRAPKIGLSNEGGLKKIVSKSSYISLDNSYQRNNHFRIKNSKEFVTDLSM